MPHGRLRGHRTAGPRRHGENTADLAGGGRRPRSRQPWCFAVRAHVRARCHPGAIAWLIGGPIAIGATAMFFTADAKARQHAWYAGGVEGVARRLVIAGALVAVTLAAFLVANDVARGRWS